MQGQTKSFADRAKSLTNVQLVSAIKFMESEEAGDFGMSVDHTEQLGIYQEEAIRRNCYV